MSFATHALFQPAVSLPREHLAAIQHIINDAMALQSRPTRPPPPPYHNIQRHDPSTWFKPRMDLFESHSGSDARSMMTATFELPGLRKEDVHINVLDNQMIVAGDRRNLHSAATTATATVQDEEMMMGDGEEGGAVAESTVVTAAVTKNEETRVSASSSWVPEPREGYTIREIKRGRFKRVVPLPAGTKLEDVKASMHDGILTVTFPGSRRPVPHTIPVV